MSDLWLVAFSADYVRQAAALACHAIAIIVVRRAWLAATRLASENVISFELIKSAFALITRGGVNE